MRALPSELLAGMAQQLHPRGNVVKVIRREANPFGFIRPDDTSLGEGDSKSVYFRVADVRAGASAIAAGTRVTFELAFDEKRRKFVLMN